MKSMSDLARRKRRISSLLRNAMLMSWWLVSLIASQVTAKRYAVPIGISTVCALAFLVIAVPRIKKADGMKRWGLAVLAGVIAVVLIDNALRTARML